MTALRATPFLWGARVDLLAFGGSAAVALALVAVGHALGWSEGPMPEWGWLAFVLVVDVAHVWATLFRTYLDREEIARRRALYVALPAGLYVAGVALHAASALAFWRVLAYLAVFRFVRQQAGWVAIYRARAGEQAAPAGSSTTRRSTRRRACLSSCGTPSSRARSRGS
ncbi:MAG: hypothetical protein U0235_07145 [Polyangiaceae bacterium]